MKNLFVFALSLLLSASSYGQLVKAIAANEEFVKEVINQDRDILIDLLGDSTRVKITQVGSDDITYLKNGSSISFSIKKSDLSSVVFASGEVLEINPLAGSGDARNILITENKSDVKGLKSLGEVIGRQAAIASGEGRDYIDSAYLKAQKEALALGGKIMYVTKAKLVIVPGAPFYVVKAEVYQ